VVVSTSEDERLYCWSMGWLGSVRQSCCCCCFVVCCCLVVNINIDQIVLIFRCNTGCVANAGLRYRYRDILTVCVVVVVVVVCLFFVWLFVWLFLCWLVLFC
jgi:hypothetical protein